MSICTDFIQYVDLQAFGPFTNMLPTKTVDRVGPGPFLIECCLALLTTNNKQVSGFQAES